MGKNDFRFSRLVNCKGSEGVFLETVIKENSGKIFFKINEEKTSGSTYEIFSISQEYIDYVLYELNKFKEKAKKINNSIK